MNTRIDLETIVQDILSSKKYASVDEVLVRRIASENAGKYRSAKEVLKETKNAIHRIHEAYIGERAHEKAEEIMNCGFAYDLSTHEKLLSLHASSRERLRDYGIFYEKLFAITGFPDRLFDIACGFNPFSLFYMRQAGANISHYLACDMNVSTARIIDRYFTLAGQNGKAMIRDVVTGPFPEHVGLALCFKLLPLVEQQKKGEGAALLRTIRADRIAVSFPLASLSGRKCGMWTFYSEYFEKAAEGFEMIGQFTTENEIVFVIGRADTAAPEKENP